MPCQVGIRRPEDACSRMLLIINRASVYGLPQVLRPVTPLGSQPPFGVGQSWNPYPAHYRLAFASSRSCTRCTFLRTYAWATRSRLRGPRVQRAYHVPRVVLTNGRRAPLYTGGNSTCVGRPLKSPEPVPPPILGLEPLSRLSSAGLRCVTPRLHFRYPYPSFPAAGPPRDSASRRLLRA